VAKILVADDNSNIQKMVGLALKDQGIDVVAVGNGEAAVRKIADLKPDLVLADVFMPVRNGYEVCKYVKDDSALSHIPVILLVGAFDPLDEQEAQRVGADGVLKKPFVPPDPLISMVKSALSRSGVPVGVPAEEPVAVKAEPAFKPLAMQTPPPPPPAFEEPHLDEIPVRPAPISIDRGAQPLAFGSLLETPATPETEVDDAAFVSTPRIERDWKSDEEEMDVAEEEAAEETQSSWRSGGTDLDDNDIPAGKKDWREVAFASIPDTASKPSYSTVEQEPAAAEWVTAEQVLESAAAPSAYAAEETRSSAVAKEVEEETERVTETAQAPPSPHAIAMPDIISVQDTVDTIPEPIAPVVPAVPPAPAEAAPTENSSWMSVAPSPWDAEVAKAGKLAATWDTSVAIASERASAVPAAPELEPEPEIVSAPLPAATEEAIREEAAQVVEEITHESEEPAAELEVSPAPLAEELPATLAPSVDEMVAKVLAKMDPSVLQAMTKELLKPVIETIVREELNRK
jgi:CheY-like chemotaxis protein